MTQSATIEGMHKLAKLKQTVAVLYEAQDPGRNDWADWLYDQHLPFVARKSRELAKQFGAHIELAEAAAWLHDVADVKMKRKHEGHEQASLDLARELMQKVGFTEEEIAIVVDDAIRLHSCYDGIKPKSLEGQVLATADALAHLTTDFYLYTTRVLHQEMTLEQTKSWVLAKAQRDFEHKLCFDEIKQATRPDYEAIKNLFSRPPVTK